MYTNWEKNPCRDETYNKSRKIHKNLPSFSSTLLDEIYRSMDGGAEKSQDITAHKEKPVKKQVGSRGKNGNTVASTKTLEADEKASLTRACLFEKWMEKEANEKAVAKRRQFEDNDVLFFSSTSSSSDSSGALSSSDTEFFGSVTKPKVSCFSSKRPKPVWTGASARDNKPQDLRKFEDNDDGLIKSKSRALKIYANLKKVKQPISPGVRLTGFINSLFSNGNGKKSKNLDASDNKGFGDLKASSLACSSAASFSRSCLSKYSPRSRENMRNGAQRTVRFQPVSVIVDEDLRPCGKKSIYDEEGFDNYAKRPPLPPNALAELKFSKMEKNKKVEEAAVNALKGYNSKRGDDFSLFRKIHNRDNEEEEEEEEDEDDGMSDSSSDLFELDHLALFGNNRFCEELPVYETTHLETNRAIASRLIR